MNSEETSRFEDRQPDEPENEEQLMSQLEEIHKLSPKDYAKIGGYVVAAAAVGAAAWWLIKKGQNRISMEEIGDLTISEGDRHAPDIVALVQRTGENGEGSPTDLAISLPKALSAVDKLRNIANDKILFAMQSRSRSDSENHISFAYPLRDNGSGEHLEKYGEGIKTAAGWLAKVMKRKPSE